MGEQHDSATGVEAGGGACANQRVLAIWECGRVVSENIGARSVGLMRQQICVASDVGTDVPQVVRDMHRNERMCNNDGLGVPQASADAEQARGYCFPIHRIDSA